jgi:hypothetical protein
MFIQVVDEVDDTILQSADAERMDNVNDFYGVLHYRRKCETYGSSLIPSFKGGVENSKAPALTAWPRGRPK